MVNVYRARLMALRAARLPHACCAEAGCADGKAAAKAAPTEGA